MTAAPAATIGMMIDDVDTPALIVDLDAFEANNEAMKRFVAGAGVRLRAHAKTHKSADIARLQIENGGACGICCQKVSEAEALVGAGISDVMISNEVVSPRKIERLAALAKRARILVCVDDAQNIRNLSEAAGRHGAVLECLVEIDAGAGRCGVEPGSTALLLAEHIVRAPGLRFAGLQAYHGKAQHLYAFEDRRVAINAAIEATASTVALLETAGIVCDIVAGAGTGSYRMEAASGVYNELQCGSYIFMDADYGKVRDETGALVTDFKNSLFVYASVMSKAKRGQAVCDAGLKAMSAESGMPVIYGRNDLKYVNFSDEHGVIADPADALRLNDKLMLVPGHCDPTVNLHDWYVGVRNGRVETLWPVTARGRSV